MTTEGARLGTVGYMSPEQTRGDPVDHRTDLWSLGVVLYEMLTGARPFRGESEDAVVFGVRNDQPPPIAALAPDVPSELARVVERCMAKDPAERYASAGDVRAALEPAVAGRELAGVETARLEAAAPEPAVSARRVLSRRVRWLAVSGIALIALLSAGLWVVRRAVNPPRAVSSRLLSTFAGEPGAATFSPDGDIELMIMRNPSNPDAQRRGGSCAAVHAGHSRPRPARATVR